MVERARFLLAEGFSLLIPDLPDHGESSGDHLAFGLEEAAAIDAMLDFQATRFSGQPIGVVAVSLGGALFLMAERRVRVEAVVLESVFPTLREALDHRMTRFLGPAGPPLTPGLVAAVKLLRGLSTDSVRPIDHAATLACPVLAIHGAADRSTRLEGALEWFAQVRSPKEFWSLENAAHEDLFAAAGPEYARRVLTFFRKHLK
jgi:pimeloyl-ACP methyl ester carboxylesterase